MQWNLTTILLAVGIFLLGYGIGLGEMHLRQAKKVKRLEEELRRKESASSTDISPVPPQPISALRLWFDDQQSATLELDGVPLPSPQQVTPAQRRRLITLINTLRPWIEAPAVRVSASPTPPSPPPKPSTTSSASQSAQLASLPSSLPASIEPPVAALSIVEQIDQILKRLLAGTSFAGQVRLRERIGGGIEIWVGAKQYTAIEEVKEAEVQAAIRAAIAEWERRA